MRGIDEVTYINWFRIIHTTSATPVVCECSDGEHYYTKFYEGVEGPRELVNEFVAYKLAKLLKLPIPPAALIKINHDFEVVIGGENRLVKAVNKYAFGSRELKRVSAFVDENFLRICENKNDLLPIIVFDHLIGNTDRERNTANLLYRLKDKIIFIIDHGRIFEAGTIWDCYTCKQRENEEIELKDFAPDTIYGKILDNVNVAIYREECLERFNKITRYDIQEIFDSIPPEWDCNEADRNAAVDFLWKRFQCCESLVDKILEIKR